MKSKLAIMTSVGLAAGLVSGCGGGDQGQAAAGAGGGMAPSSVSLSTGDVLTLAQKTSDSAAPFAVDAGAVTLNDTSDTSEPINVNAM
jgi:hypothetical protein